MSHTHVFIITETPINLLAVNLPPYIGINDTHPLHGGRCTVLVTGGASIEDGVTAVLAVYPDARATTSKEEAAELLKQTEQPAA